MAEITVEFRKEKDTKNTVRYNEVVAEGDPEKIGSLYVQKWALKELGNPQELTVVIKPKE